MFDGEDKEGQGSKADGGVDEDDFFLGEGKYEGIYVSFYLGGGRDEAGCLVPTAEFEQPGTDEHHAGCGRGDGQQTIRDT